MLRPRIYVASAISLGRLTDNLHAAHKAGIALLKAGFAPMVPHGSTFWGNRLTGINDRTGIQVAFVPEKFAHDIPHAVWLEICLPWVKAADGVLRLPGESKGADQEVAFANEHCVPVFGSVEEVKAFFFEARPITDGAHAAADCDVSIEEFEARR